MNIIQSKNLTKIYGQGDTAVKALDAVNIAVKQGEFAAVCGSSGSGKSTLLHMLGAVDKPTSGCVSIDGEDVFSRGDKALSALRRRMIGFVFQSYNLIPVLTAQENIALPLKLDGRAPDKDRMNEILFRTGLSNRADNLPNQLSGGQQQRVAIARALIAEPAIILADEPTGNLDRRSGAEIMQMIADCSRLYGQTVIVITHDAEVAARADRIIYIEDGRVAEGEK